MRKQDLLRDLKINEQTDISGSALDIDTENIRRSVHAKLDFADSERKQMTICKPILSQTSCKVPNISFSVIVSSPL